MGISRFLSPVRLFREESSPEGFHILIGQEQFGMGDDRGVEKEESFVPVFFNKPECLLMNQFRGVYFHAVAAVFFQDYFLCVVPEVSRVVIVCQALAEVSVELVKTLPEGIS